MSVRREQASEEEIEAAFIALRLGIKKRIKKHGLGKWLSIHEGYGIMAEEFNKECLDAVHANDTEQFVAEMMDCAITGIWAHVSLSKRLLEEQDNAREDQDHRRDMDPAHSG